MLKNIAILGSTGSIGKNVLEVVRLYPGRFRVLGLAAGNNIKLLHEQIEAFNPILISVATQQLAEELAANLAGEWKEKIVFGNRGNELVATLPEVDTVVSAIVGAAGLLPTYRAIEAGKNIALANKETMVMAGDLVNQALIRHKAKLLPIDSEHSAIAQCMTAGNRQDVAKIILTASGGPFRNMPEKQLWSVTPEQALRHPNWNMGKKISVDSATLMNKGLEVIEARWLFNMEVENIEVLIHPQSIVHSMVEFTDGSVVSQMGIPDMRIPISYALAHPERLRLNLPRLNLIKSGELTFSSPDFIKFPALKLAYQVCKRGGILPAVLNAANEIAVESFLAGRIRFPEIALVVSETVSKTREQEAADINAVIEADLAARMLAESIVEAISIKTRQKMGKEIASPALPERSDSFTSNR